MWVESATKATNALGSGPLGASLAGCRGVYHVTALGTGGASSFLQDLDRLDFVALLGSMARRFDWLCHAYYLMRTHYHLVLEAHPASTFRRAWGG